MLLQEEHCSGQAHTQEDMGVRAIQSTSKFHYWCSSTHAWCHMSNKSCLRTLQRVLRHRVVMYVLCFHSWSLHLMVWVKDTATEENETLVITWPSAWQKATGARA